MYMYIVYADSLASGSNYLLLVDSGLYLSVFLVLLSSKSEVAMTRLLGVKNVSKARIYSNYIHPQPQSSENTGASAMSMRAGKWGNGVAVPCKISGGGNMQTHGCRPVQAKVGCHGNITPPPPHTHTSCFPMSVTSEPAAADATRRGAQFVRLSDKTNSKSTAECWVSRWKQCPSITHHTHPPVFQCEDSPRAQEGGLMSKLRRFSAPQNEFFFRVRGCTMFLCLNPPVHCWFLCSFDSEVKLHFCTPYHVSCRRNVFTSYSYKTNWNWKIHISQYKQPFPQWKVT